MRSTMAAITLLALIKTCDPSGQGGPSVDPSISIQQQVQQSREAGKQVVSSGENVQKDAQDILVEADKAQSKLTADSQRAVLPHLSRIKQHAGSITTEAEKIKQLGLQLGQVAANLEASIVEVNQLKSFNSEQASQLDTKDAQIEALEKEITNVKAEKNNYLKYLVVAGALLMAISITLCFVVQNPKMVYGALGGLILILVALFVQTLTKYFVWIGRAGGLTIVGLVIWQVLAYRSKHQALEEVVETAEMAKDGLSAKARLRLFGQGPDHGHIGNMQSKATHDEVAKIRKQKKTKWEPTAVS